MNAAEKAALLADLASGRIALLDALSGVSEEVAARAPGPGKWSILQCVEHLAVSEEYLFGQILCAKDAAGPATNLEREARIRAAAADRTRRIAAPQEGLPAGRCSTLREAAERYLAARERTVRFVEECQDDPRARVTSHPLIPQVNCHEMLIMIAAHPLRHARQIEEIRAAQVS